MRIPGIAALGLIAALNAMEPTGLKPKSIECPTPKYLADMPRRQRKRIAEASNHAAMNLANRLAKYRRQRDPLQDAVNSLTGWQRNQWAKAGYPGLRQKDVAKVVAFRIERAS